MQHKLLGSTDKCRQIFPTGQLYVTYQQYHQRHLLGTDGTGSSADKTIKTQHDIVGCERSVVQWDFTDVSKESTAYLQCPTGK
jgi:hypothetical protein